MVHDNVLEKLDSSNIAVYSVWMPVLGGDSPEEALKSESYLTDRRVTHYWDADSTLGRLYGRMLTLPRGRQLAWDIYFVYEPGVTWGETLPEPTVWMHQLGMDDRHLNGPGLQKAIADLLPEGPPDPSKTKKRATISM